VGTSLVRVDREYTSKLKTFSSIGSETIHVVLNRGNSDIYPKECFFSAYTKE